MANVEALPNGSYRVRWWDGGKHPSKTITAAMEPNPRKRKALAEEFAREKERELALGLPRLRDPRKTLTEMVQEEFVPVVVLQKEPKTQELYRSLWRAHLKKEFGKYPVSRIEAGMIEDWLARSSVGVVTKRKALVLLGQMMRFAMKRRYTLANPVDLVDKPSLPAPDPVHPPTPLEVERIRKAFFDMDRPQDAILVGTLAYAGCRPLSEGLALSYGDVRDKTLLVRAPKTKTFRAVDLLEPLREDLNWWMKRQLAFPTSPLFPNHRGDFWTTTTYNNWRKRVWSEVADFPIKNLRHTFVSLLIRDEAYTRREVADQAGHSLDVQDRVYSHVWAELRGTGKAEDVIREARAEVFGAGESGLGMTGTEDQG